MPEDPTSKFPSFPKIDRRELHRNEEHFKHVFRDQIAEAAGIIEVLISLVVLVALIIATIPLLGWLPGLFVEGNGYDIEEFLSHALAIVIGVEFIKMLAKHSPGSSLEVLLYAIARHMVVGHNSAAENLISMAAIALIFIIRKFWFIPSFGSSAEKKGEGHDQTPPEEDDPEFTYC